MKKVTHKDLKETTQYTCTYCDGTGEVIEENEIHKCPVCGGSGTITREL